MKKEALIKFYSNYKLYIFPLGVILSSLILIFFIILPQTLKLIGNQKAENELILSSKFLEVKAQTLESFNQEDLSQKVEFALNAYPAEKDFNNALAILQQITSKSGFVIVNLSLGAAATTPSSQSYNVKIEISGPKPLFPLLLSNIDSAQRLMKVSGIETSSKDAQTLDAAIGVEVFYSPVPNNLGTVDSPLPEVSPKEEEILAKLTSVDETVSQPSTTSPRGKANPFE